MYRNIETRKKIIYFTWSLINVVVYACQLTFVLQAMVILVSMTNRLWVVSVHAGRRTSSHLFGGMWKGVQAR